MYQLGLIGREINHSFSPKYFAGIFQRENRTDCRYDLFPIHDIHLFPDLVRERPDILGLNVTIPYKREIIPFLDVVDTEAALVGAVNTLARTTAGWKGYNTDMLGFHQLIQPVLDRWQAPKNALVLGTGGVSQSAEYVLRKEGFEVLLVSRHSAGGHLTYAELEASLVAKIHLIINCTPLGMWPAVDTFPPIPYAAIGPEHFLVDLVYNPGKTLFLEQGLRQSAHCIGGIQMLYAQAEEAWKIWKALIPESNHL